MNQQITVEYLDHLGTDLTVVNAARKFDKAIETVKARLEIAK